MVKAGEGKERNEEQGKLVFFKNHLEVLKEGVKN